MFNADFLDRRGRRAGARRDRPVHPGLRPGRVVDRLTIPAIERRGAEHRQQLALLSRITGRSTAAGRPTSARASSTSRRSRPATSSASATTASCRASATAYDVKGNGNHIVHVTYGQYSGPLQRGADRQQQPGRQPGRHLQPLPGAGGPGPRLRAGTEPGELSGQPDNASVIDADANVFTDPAMKSPLIHEFSTSYGANIANGTGYAEVAYVFRKTTSMIEDFFTRADGTTRGGGERRSTPARSRTRSSGTPTRRTASTRAWSSSRATSWPAAGRSTASTRCSCKNDGNYEGEGTNTPGATSRIGDYPEAFAAGGAAVLPGRPADSFQRHRMRAWTIYNFGMGRAGDLSVSGLWRVDSGGVYSLLGGQPAADDDSAQRS